MTRTVRKMLGILLCAILLVSMSPAALAASQTGSLTLVMKPDHQISRLSGVSFALYHIGTSAGGTSWKMDEPFASADYNSAKMAREIDAVIEAVTRIIHRERIAPMATGVTGADNSVLFDGLEAGLYYAEATGGGPDGLTVQPLIATIPSVLNGKVVYDVQAEPKYNYTPPEDGPALINIVGQKIWDDNNDEHRVRPATVEVILLANGVPLTATPTWTTTGNVWSYAFWGLLQFDDQNVAIEYTVQETPVEYYDTTIDGYTITNRIREEEPDEYIDLSGRKTWNDINNETGARPVSITVSLLRNGAVVETRTVTEADDWAWTFEHMPRDDGYGHIYTYTLREDAVEGYFTQIVGLDVTNSLLPEIPPEIPPFNERTEEELEELIDLFDYTTPLYGMQQTGDDLPAYPFVFAGLGVAALILLVLFNRKSRRGEAGR